MVHTYQLVPVLGRQARLIHVTKDQSPLAPEMQCTSRRAWVWGAQEQMAGTPPLPHTNSVAGDNLPNFITFHQTDTAILLLGV